MSRAITKEVRALVETASEMFDETGCVPGIDGEEVRAGAMVPDVKEYISGSIDNPEVPYDWQIWDTPGFTLVLSWLAQKWLRKCHKLAPRGNKNPEVDFTLVLGPGRFRLLELLRVVACRSKSANNRLHASLAIRKRGT